MACVLYAFARLFVSTASLHISSDKVPDLFDKI